MIIDEPRPRCLGCGKPLKRSTYFRSFYNLLPNGKEYPTTIAECQSLIEPGHHIHRFNYIRDAIRDHRGQIVGHGDDWYFYGANVWNGTYGTFGKCGTCLPYDKHISHGKKLKLLPVPVEPPARVTGSVLIGSAAMVLRSGASRAVSLVSGLRERVGRTMTPPVPNVPLEPTKSVPVIGVPLGSYEFVYGPLSEFTDAELVEMWQALASQRFEKIGIYEKDRGNRFARESKNLLKVCMLKVRAVAEARGVSVDFVVPALIKFEGEDWHDLEDGFGGFDPSPDGVELRRDGF